MLGARDKGQARESVQARERATLMSDVFRSPNATARGGSSTQRAPTTNAACVHAQPRTCTNMLQERTTQWSRTTARKHRADAQVKYGMHRIAPTPPATCIAEEGRMLATELGNALSVVRTALAPPATTPAGRAGLAPPGAAWQPSSLPTDGLIIRTR